MEVNGKSWLAVFDLQITTMDISSSKKSIVSLYHKINILTSQKLITTSQNYIMDNWKTNCLSTIVITTTN